MKDENQKMKREITRRTERYVKNEAEYREEINELEKDMRIRRGFSDTNGKGDPETIDKINAAICDNIDGYKEQYNLLVDEHYNELARKYNSLISNGLTTELTK